MSEQPPNGPSVPSLNVIHSGSANLTVTVRLDPAFISFVTTLMGNGHTRQTSSTEHPVAESTTSPLEAIPSPSKTSPSKTGGQTVSDYIADDVSTDSPLSQVEAEANDGKRNNDTHQSLSPLTIIGRIEGYPVYDWTSYPYGPNAPEENDIANCFFVKKPVIEAENLTRSAFTLKLAYSYLTYGSDRRAPFWVRKQCMGVFQCSVQGCSFLATPVRGKKKV
jgi:hypothetical protein